MSSLDPCPSQGRGRLGWAPPLPLTRHSLASTSSAWGSRCRGLGT